MTETCAPTGPGKRGGFAPLRPWDPLVRITHWALALAVLANGLLNKPGGAIHIWIGWAVMGLLAVRLAWGVVGPAEARFSAFPANPRAALAHLLDLVRGNPKEHPSHNPAGALMAYALWACLCVVTVTGIVMTDGKSPVTITEEKTAVAAGDWSVLVAGGDREEDEGLKGLAEEVHEVVANLILILAAMHVAGVVLESRALGRNLVRPMLFDRRRP